MSPIENFRAALRAAGLDYPGEIIADGNLHRFKADGDRRRNSWYVLHAGPPTAGSFGCWKRDVTENWCDQSRNLSQAQWEAVRRRWQEVERERARSEVERHAQARKTAAWILTRAKPAQSHAYLKRKGVTLCGEVREYHGALVLPLRDACGELHSLQFIHPNGDKILLRGGKVAGCSFTISDQPDGALVICEGYATGASIHAATGAAVLCAMNCHNLKAVAEATRKKFPGREIILAADNDQFTAGNPGLTAATKAALAIQGKIASPHFADATRRPTDFNDLHKQEGLETVKTQIEAATKPQESDEENLQRLAELPSLEYQRNRGAEAKRLGIRVSILDQLVDTRRKKSDMAEGELQGRKLNMPDVELWPETATGSDVLNEIALIFANYVRLPDGAAEVLALWAAHTHCFECFGCTPRLNISSPDKRCGKTTLRDVLALFVPHPLPTENLTVAVLFRAIEAYKPTILADESDAWLRENEALRGMLNAGHRQGGKALRCEGESNEIRAFNVFAPAVLCGIGTLPETLQDRSIAIRLERAKPGELNQRFDARHVERETELCRKLARFCSDNKKRLEACEPVLPSSAFNRIADNWRPLFAIAEIAGADWPQRAVAAFRKLTGNEDGDAQGAGAALLRDIRGAFREIESERIWTETLCGILNGMQEGPYADMRSGQGINAHRLAKLLGRFKISSRKIRLPGELKPKQGYCWEDFQEVFERYVGDSNRNIGTSIAIIDDPTNSQVEQPGTAFQTQTLETPNNGARCSSVPLSKRAGREMAETESQELLL